MIKRIIFITLCVILLGIALIGAYVAGQIYAPLNIQYSITEIPIGATGRSIAAILYNDDIIRNKTIFRALIRFKDIDKNLRFGQYLFSGNLNMLDVLDKIRSGEIIVERVTIPEGLSVWRTFRIIANSGIGNYENLVRLAKDPEFASEITGFDVVSLEGFLYPDTYIFCPGMTDENIIIVMVENFFNRIDAKGVIIDCPEQFYRDLILASIIEREVIHRDEMPLVASVYLNRLRANRRLQADPTVVYHFESEHIHIYRVLYRHLRIDTPFNTYIHLGLPPHPICSPSAAAIHAAQNPANTNYFYFFASGGNRHTFTRTGSEHMRLLREHRVRVRETAALRAMETEYNDL